MKRMMLALLLFVLPVGFAQDNGTDENDLPPFDVLIGQRWVGTNEAAFYGGIRTYFPLGVELFGVELFAVPEIGVDRDTLSPYGRAEFNIGTEYGTAAAFVTYMDGIPRVNVEFRFCLFSDRCDE